ncbi:hypothetical protein HF521_007458 [Silurus meridionalis]|uniref:Integrin beta n=1 Tax=Silurus meridionalis TaxID=175797 RepID=A0A8T0ATJ3_SILME|nr:hypothetical protein HF521_007458 [Silurus meridionalis]
MVSVPIAVQRVKQPAALRVCRPDLAAYCSDEVFGFDRCDLLENLNSSSCAKIVSVHSSRSMVQNIGINKNMKHSQVAPQQMRMTLLPGEEHELEIEVFEPARGPLDLYILMDFSNSMSDDLDNLKRMGDELAQLVGTLSDDYTIGFGKFVDKVTEPQTDMRPSKLKEPWANSDPPFSFKHVINLTSDISNFRHNLQGERISGNLDAPEGGFDAILQAAVCQSQIGWRKHSTHLLVFSTESAFHYEADGINVLAGILQRNDEACHLDSNGLYTHATRQDYPSVPTLVRLLVQNNIIPIFAITNHSLSYYEKLLHYFPIAELGVLTDDSSNILNIIKNAFDSIRSKISIQAENKPRAIGAQILSASGVASDYGNFRIQPGEIGKFKVRLNAKTSVSDKPVCSLNTNDREGMIRVKPTTFSSALHIQTSVLCETCECELTPTRKAQRCNGNGDLVCGTCRCYDKWLGPYCNCSSQVSSDSGGCVAPGTSKPCNERGDCLCGTCLCYNPNQYDGQFCQFCACCPCCAMGRMVGFKEDHYMLRQSLLSSDHLDTPMVRTGPPKSTDVVRWKVKDNVHRGPNHPQNQTQPNPKEIIDFPLTLRLLRQFSEELSHPEARNTETLKQQVEENLNNVYRQIPGAQRVQKTRFRTQRNAGKRQNNTIVDTVLSAPRSSFHDILTLTDKQVQAGNFSEMKVVPGFYTVATDRGVESVDVRVPLFIKDEDDDKKQLLVEAVDVPVGIATIGKRHVNITVIKEHAKSILTFLQPSYTFSRQDGVANIPISRDIIEDGRTQVTYCTRDLTAKDKKDYLSVDGDLMYQAGETQKMVPVKLLELGEGDSLIDKQPKQFVMDLSNPRQGAKLGKYPRTTINIADKPDPSVIMFKNSTQTFNISDALYTVPVIRTQGLENPSTVTWRTISSRFNLSGPLKFAPGEMEKNIVIDTRTQQVPSKPENFQLELYDPSSNSLVRDRKTTQVNIIDPKGDFFITSGTNPIKASSPTGRILPPANIETVATGPKKIRLNWNPQSGAKGYKVKYWIYGDPEADAQVVDVKSTHAELTNLYPFCDYEMRVCSYNAQGDGDYSDIVQCQTLEDVPSEPGRLAFNVIGPTVTQLSWAEPAEPNGVITDYEVVYTPINEDSKPTGPDKKVKIDNPKKRMLLIENLQPSQTYRYKVRASNKVGWGPYRDATINLATQPHRPMSIPIIPDIPIVDAEAGDDYDSFLMYSNEVLRSPTASSRPSVSEFSEDQIMNGKWDQGFLFPGGGSGSLSRNISTTNTYITSKGDSVPRKHDIHTEDVILRKRSENRNYYDSDGIRDSIVMSDLTGGFSDILSGSSFSQTTTTSYSLNSRVHNRSDDINEALQNLDRVLQDTRLQRGVPETPSRLVFSALGPTALKVSWQEPHCEKPISGYCVLYQLLSGGEMKRMDITNPAQNSVVVQDLLPNQSYLFKVKAESQEGWGPEREGVITIESAVDPKSPLSPVPGSSFTLSTPSAPGPLVFTALSPETLQLSWDKPRKPNGEILGYVVTCEQLHGGGDQRSFQLSGNSATSLTVSDLTENVPYKFKVQAQTTQGFGPEREGIITIESQDGSMGQYGGQSVMRREVFNLPSQSSTHTTHTMFTEPFTTPEGIMMSSRQVTQQMSGSVTRQVEMVQRGVTSTVTRKQYYEA